MMEMMMKEFGTDSKREERKGRRREKERNRENHTLVIIIKCKELNGDQDYNEI